VPGRRSPRSSRPLRRLAAALEAEGVDPAAQRVRTNAVGRRAPRALTRAELGRLLAMPDRRTRRGRRDLAIMLLLGQTGLRRAEVCALRYEDLQELRSHPDPRRRAALAPRAAEQTGWVVHVRHPKRGRARSVDLTAVAVEALRAWTQSRPESATDHLFVSLARNRPPEPLVPRALNKLVAAYAERAGLPEDRRTPARPAAHLLHATRRRRPGARGHGRARRPPRRADDEGLCGGVVRAKGAGSAGDV